MQLSVILILGLAALICSIANALGRCPLWIPVFILSVIVLLGVLPLGGHSGMLR